MTENPTRTSRAAEIQKVRENEKSMRATPKPAQATATQGPRPLTLLRGARVMAAETAPARAYPGNHDSRQRRADHAGPVEDGRVQGNGVEEVLVRNHVRHKGLARWNIKSIDPAYQSRQHDHMPCLNSMSNRKSGKN